MFESGEWPLTSLCIEDQELNSYLTGLQMSLQMLTEMYRIDESLYAASLSDFMETLKSENNELSPDNCLYYSTESALNEIREFLLHVISDAKEAETKELTLNSLVQIAFHRKSLEDLIIVYNIIDQSNLRVDLSEQLETNLGIEISKGKIISNIWYLLFLIPSLYSYSS